MVAIAQRLDGGFHDVLGRPEIRLADAKVDDVLALALQLGGAREHGEGVLLADAGEGGHDVQRHGGVSWTATPVCAGCGVRQTSARRTSVNVKSSPLNSNGAS